MFSNLRNNAPIYLLHKSEPRIEIGEVISVSQPQPQYNVAYQNGLMQQPKTCVDVRIKVNDLRNEVADLKDMLAQLLNSNKKGE